MVLVKNHNFEEKVLASLSPIRQEKVVLACSGGPDSMVLLHILTKFYGDDVSKWIIVAHIHHGLRDSADRDEEIVRNFCSYHQLVYECLKVDIKKEAKETKTTIEECARNVRKSWLESIRETYQATCILTAHHADDQGETLLYRITKGTSITGLVGIERFSGRYFRPLLEVSKADILKYAQDQNIFYGLDETNDDTNIPRNLLRHEVLPRLQTINPEAREAIKRLGKSATEIKEGFDIFFREIIAKDEFDYDYYHSLPLGFQHELLRCLYEKANGSTHGFSSALVQELDRFLSTRTGGKKELGKKWLVKKQGKVYLT